MPQNRNSYGPDLPRAATNILNAWVRDIQTGSLPPEAVPTDGNGKITALTVVVDGEPMTVRAFLDACREAEPEKVDAVLHALDRRNTAKPPRPYLDHGATARGGGDVLLHTLAERLSRGGAIPARVHLRGDAEPMTLRAYLDDLATDRLSPATLSGPKLELEAGASVMVAALVVRGKLEAAGLLEKAKPPRPTNHFQHA